MMNLEATIRLSGLDKLITEYLLSFSVCKHNSVPSNCSVCTGIRSKGLYERFMLDCPEARLMTGNELQIMFDHWNDEREYKLRRFFARNKVVHFDPAAYGNGANAQTITAQSFSRRPLRFGGNDRVLSDQQKFGSRIERASQKHHETDGKGNTTLHRYYGAAEQTYNRDRPVHSKKLVGNRIKLQFKGHYHSTPDVTPVPRGDHYMER